MGLFAEFYIKVAVSKILKYYFLPNFKILLLPHFKCLPSQMATLVKTNLGLWLSIVLY